MSTALASLGADNIAADIQGLLDVFRVTDHVHDEDSGLMETFDNLWRRHTDSRDEKLGSTVDDGADKLVKLSLGVVVAKIKA